MFSPLRLLRLGITPTTPTRDIRFIVVLNLGAFTALLAVLIHASYMHVTHGWAMAFTTFLQVPVLVASLWFNAKGRIVAAMLALFSVATVAPAVQSLVFGTGAGHFLFFLVLVAGIPLAVPRRVHFLVLPLILLSAGLFMGIVIFGPDIEPAVALPPEALRPMFMIISFGVVAILILVSMVSRRVAVLAENQAEREYSRSERLLASILPETVAKELKRKPHAQIAARHDDVGVLFADIVGFSAQSGLISPAQVVDRLNAIFTTFDEIVERHGAEKIKTIGDAYMVAAGVPQSVDRPVHRLAEVALDMVDACEALPAMQKGALKVRVGLHAGPVVAGVIGRQKPAYDLWGAAVNVASRLESTGLPGRVQISRESAERLSDEFVVERRGDVLAKGVGRLDVYLLCGRRAPRA